MTTDPRLPSSATSTRASAKAYNHPSSQRFRMEERGQTKKPQDPVGAAKIRHLDEKAALNARQKHERVTLGAELDRRKLTDAPKPGGDQSSDARHKEM